MNEPTTTLIGNLTDDPQLRYTANGAAVANFTIAVNLRRFDKQQNQYVDAGTLYHRCSIWRDAAENVSESLEKQGTSCPIPPPCSHPIPQVLHDQEVPLPAPPSTLNIT